MAIGSPFEYASTLTSGIISATKRTVESPSTGFAIQNALQTDAAINPGNSGGPLINSRGEVIGLNEQIATSSGGSEGVGFAVPINTAKQAMEQILSRARSNMPGWASSARRWTPKPPGSRGCRWKRAP